MDIHKTPTFANHLPLCPVPAQGYKQGLFLSCL